MCQTTPDALPHRLPTAVHYPTLQRSRRLNATRCSFKLKHTDFKQDSRSPDHSPSSHLEPFHAHVFSASVRTPLDRQVCCCQRGQENLSKVTQRARHSPEPRISGTSFLGCIPSQDPGLRPVRGREDLAWAAEMRGRAGRARGAWR